MTDVSLNISSRWLYPLLDELGTRVASKVKVLFGQGDLRGIVQMSVDPRDYVTPRNYLADAQAVALFKKCPLTISGVDRRSAALKKWLDAEFACYKSNERFAQLQASPLPEDGVILEFLSEVRKTIRSWIGNRPPDLDEIRGKFGPGATFSDSGRLTTVPDKISSKPALTRGAYWYLLPFLQTEWGRVAARRHEEVSWVRGNRYLTVPKTALTDRSIAVEPAINVFYQLGLGTSLRKRLRNSTGWDLDHAQDLHRARAREASVTREFATLDLSNASDTVSLELVRLLLPPLWFEELSALRSPFTRVDGKWRKLEKFSSMGNGFTFELETIVFAALASCFMRREGYDGRLGGDLMVFGDDIIVPDAVAGDLCKVLAYCGFTVNPEKSFIGAVPFRESCGGDFFEGVDVRPYFIKALSDDPISSFPLHNGLRRVTKKLEKLQNHAFSMRYLDRIREVIPDPYRRCFGPQEMGDICLHTEASQLWRVKWKWSIRYLRCIRPVPQSLKWHHWTGDVVLACALYGYGDGSSGVIPRDAPFSYKVSWVPYS